MEIDDDPATTLADRLAEAALGMMDLLSIHLGDKLGYYRELASEAVTSQELALRCGTHPRYTLEWCRQQTATGLLVADSDRYALAPGVHEVLVDDHDLRFSVPLARLLAGLSVQNPRLVDAFRTGSGVGWAEFGDDVRSAQAAANRPWFEKDLVRAVNSSPELAARFAAARHIADIGCGAGWSAIGLARGWPVEVVGLDIDETSVRWARANVADAGLSDRVEVRVADPGGLEGSFDLVTAFECVHDLPYPVEVLTSAREALAPGGAVLVVDELLAEEPGPVGDPVERMMSGWSILACLPDSMTAPNSAATGTVMRPSTLARYAAEAGFTRVEPLPIEGFALLGFTLLVP